MKKSVLTQDFVSNEMNKFLSNGGKIEKLAMSGDAPKTFNNYSGKSNSYDAGGKKINLSRG
jgi:hypothetical protein